MVFRDVVHAPTGPLPDVSGADGGVLESTDHLVPMIHDRGCQTLGVTGYPHNMLPVA